MRIFVAGGSGLIGRRLVPALVAAGHEVIGSSRTPSGSSQIDEAGATGMVVDHLDRSAVFDALARARPEVVVHQLTAIDVVDPKAFDQSLAATNELRTRGLDHLLGAAEELDVDRFVAQSFTGWTNPVGPPNAATEDEPLDPSPHPATVESLAAIAHLEAAVVGSSVPGAVVRYGHLYGAGTAYAPGGAMFETVRNRSFPVVGGGDGVWSFVHVDDAVAATVSAIESPATGVFNVVDDDPAPVREWLPAFASAIGAPPPRSVPAFLARLAIGGNGIRMMTAQRGSSNDKARRTFGWAPDYPSWRSGFATLLGQADAA